MLPGTFGSAHSEGFDVYFSGYYQCLGDTYFSNSEINRYQFCSRKAAKAGQFGGGWKEMENSAASNGAVQWGHL